MFFHIVNYLHYNYILFLCTDVHRNLKMKKELISITHVFSCRVYGLRKYKNKIEKELDNA